MLSRTEIGLLGSILLFVSVGSLGAQNLLNNGGFEGSEAPWSTTYGNSVLTWSSNDVQVCPNSGSGMVSHEDVQFNTAWFSQCVENLDDSLIYELSGSIFFSGAEPDTNGYLLYRWYSTADCSGSQTSGGATPWLVGSDNPGQWLEVLESDMVPDSGTQSALVSLSVRRISPTNAGPAIVYFDDVYFGPRGLIWEDGFEQGDTCRWSATAP